MDKHLNLPFGEAENAALFRLLVSTAVDGILVIDEAGTVRLFNEACERLFGYGPAEVLGRNISMLMPSPYRQEHDGYLKNYRTTGERKIIGIGREVMAQRKDGSVFPIYLSVGEGMFGEMSLFVGIVHDISARQSASHKLQELQSELTHMSRLNEMGHMSSALAHELNQPLAAIMNYLRAAQRTVGAVEDASVVRAREMMEKALEQTSRAGQVIKRLREFTEKRDSSRTVESLNHVIQEAIELALVGAAVLDVKVQKSLAENLPEVFVDRIQIQQVVLNLVRNAVEAMEEVSIRRLTVVTRIDGEGNVQASFLDTGPGMPDEVIRRLFEAFVTTKENGMGIGLSICRSIIEAHGGRLWMEPAPGGGTEFHFSLPPQSPASR
jgi:two-component system sensor kinase FixL